MILRSFPTLSILRFYEILPARRNDLKNLTPALPGFLVKLQNNCHHLHLLRFTILSCREPKAARSRIRPQGSSTRQAPLGKGEEVLPGSNKAGCDEPQQVLFSSHGSVSSTDTGLKTSLCLVRWTATNWPQTDSCLGAQSILKFYLLSMQGPGAGGRREGSS